MRIKNWGNFIQESVIEPLDFDKFLNEFKHKKVNSISQLNDIAKKYNILFSNFDDFYNSLETEIEKKLAPKELMLLGGVKFALFNKYKNTIMIVVEEEIFIEYINNNDLTPMIKFLREVLRHESIHMQQVDRMKNKDSYKLDSSPTHNPTKYWKEKRELMAYAQSLIDQLSDQGLSKEEIKVKITQQKEINSWIWNVYSKILNASEMKRFMKYVYLYYDKL